MERNYLITRMEGNIYSFLLHGAKAVEIHCDPPKTEHALGSIYIGKIKNIAKNIGAAFVEIAPDVVCHLALDDMRCPVYVKKGASRLPQAGDELLVQIAREGMKAKRPSVTTNLTLYGKYVLLTTGSGKHAVSSKLPKAEKERLLSVAGNYDCSAAGDVKKASHPDDGQKNEPSGDRQTDGEDHRSEIISSVPRSWLFRTNAGGAPEELLIRDMEQLCGTYEELTAHAQYRTCFSCLYEVAASWLRRLSNLYDSEVEQILTDDEDLYREITDYLARHQPEDTGKLRLYQDRLLPMHKLYSLETQLAQALQEKVWLNSGGYLVIQPTEALTVIDVNTGKFEGGKKREAAFLKINCEAAVEIARQLRLRNLSGIIVVDFINMEAQEQRDELLSLLDAKLRRDPVRTVLVDMTKLSLVEITRQKRERPLAECIRDCAAH